MIPMRQFLREHEITGDVEVCVPGSAGATSLEVTDYRVIVRRGERRFEATLRRPAGAPAPSLSEAIAEIARNVSLASDGPQTPEVLREVGRLRDFLGDQTYTELLFEFGRRPEEEMEAGDQTGDPARPDEMTNQEAGALTGAARESRPLGWARYLIGVPVVALGATGLLLARGRRATALAVAAGGAVTTLIAAGGVAQWRRRARRLSVQEKLESLTDQTTSIQTGSAPS